MHPNQRVRLFALLMIIIVITLIYTTSSARRTRSSDFYVKTSQALQEQAARAADAKAAEAFSDDQVKARLREAEEAAKRSAEKKGARVQEIISDEARRETGNEREVVGGAAGDGDGKSVAGRVYLKPGEKETVDGVARVGNTGDGVQDGPQPETQETLREHEVEQELNSILKKSPIIIFSKTYCPYSKKAKRIFHQYKITPAPYIVEIDEHPLGPELQAALAKSTGRRTVPNILINGKSIGGGDDIEALHESGKLVNTVKSMGGKRITEAALIEAS